MIDYRYNFPEHENNKDIFGEQNNYNVFINLRGLHKIIYTLLKICFIKSNN